MTARYAVLSDVHANTEALTAVLRETEGLEIICLGDFVDYGSEPNEVIEMLGDAGGRSVLGNHDDAVLRADTSMLNPSAAISSAWSRKALSRESSDFLSRLPLSLSVDLDGTRGYFTHGSPDDNLWEYVDPRTHHLLFGHYLDKLDVGVVGLGHTHVPYVWREKHGVVFNPGSVGQPRDGDSRASFAVLSYDGDEVSVEIRRVAYDIKKAAMKIRAAGLPEVSAVRLSTGT